MTSLLRLSNQIFTEFDEMTLRYEDNKLQQK